MYVPEVTPLVRLAGSSVCERGCIGVGGEDMVLVRSVKSCPVTRSWWFTAPYCGMYAERERALGWEVKTWFSSPGCLVAGFQWFTAPYCGVYVREHCGGR